MTHEDGKSFSAVRQMDCAFGRYQRALVSEGIGTLLSPTDVKDRPKRDIKPVRTMPQTTDLEEICPFELMDQSREADGSSIIEVEMVLGSILFASKDEALED